MPLVNAHLANGEKKTARISSKKALAVLFSDTADTKQYGTGSEPAQGKSSHDWEMGQSYGDLPVMKRNTAAGLRQPLRVLA
ncbi:MAG: hypothetical protein U0V87_17220 [Acidobacteriota bacterium]